MTDIPRSLDDLSPARVTTAFDLPGYTTVRSLGVAQGIIVRSRSIVGSFGASLQTIFGGNITLYTSLCEKAREHAFDRDRFGCDRSDLLRHGRHRRTRVRPGAGAGAKHENRAAVTARRALPDMPKSARCIGNAARPRRRHGQANPARKPREVFD